MAETPRNPESDPVYGAELDRLEEQTRDPQAAAPPPSDAPSTPTPAAIRGETSDEPSAAAATPPERPTEIQAKTPPVEVPAETAPPGAEPPTVIGSSGVAPKEAQPLEMAEFSEMRDEAALANIELLDDVELDVKIELGRTQMYIEDVLRLGEGSVVELDKLAGDPVDVYVNDRLVARGEVLVLNDNFCVRVNDIISVNPELEQSKK
jgi:flagellar motor switch protein FliN/FliY